MGNVEMHEMEPVRKDERQEWDLSVPLDYKGFCKHINGEYSHKCLSELPASITDTIYLHERINLSFNCLATLPAQLPLRMPHLCFINLSYNKISSLTESVGLFFHLKELLLPHNCLVALPSSFVRLVKLEKLDLSFNQLESLPENIGEMESLKKLNVCHNNLQCLPKSLGHCKTIEIILASNNCCVSQPPQCVCDSGSEKTIRFLKQLVSGKVLLETENTTNIFPRVRGNVVQTSISNRDSARAQYVQIQTETMNTASRIKTPLLPPYDATQLHPHDLKDRIIGLLYGAVIGDALGTATEFLSPDECKFHYDENYLSYKDIIRDEHRMHWRKGDWTFNSDQMLLVLDSLLQWAGVVDELEFAKRLISWKRNGIPELGIRESYLSSTIINLVLQDKNYCENPHQVAASIHSQNVKNNLNGTKTSSTASLVFVDNGSLSRALLLGVPHFYDLNEVVSNSARICLSTHHDERCVAACVSLSVAVGLMLQGKYSLEDQSCIDELLKISVQHGANYIQDEAIRKEFICTSSVKDFSCLGISEINRICHPFKACSAAFASLKISKDFKSTLSQLLMMGGNCSSVIGCICGSLLGCKYGFSHLPEKWIEELNSQNKEWLNAKINALLDMMGLP